MFPWTKIELIGAVFRWTFSGFRGKFTLDTEDYPEVNRFIGFSLIGAIALLVILLN